jgi:hypothetical protein
LVVWSNSPFPCGTFPDLTIARRKSVKYLLPGEKFIADRGYRDGNKYADTPTGNSNPSQRMKRTVRARHETFNCRLKKYKVLSTTYRNGRETHFTMLHIIMNILQIEIENGYPLYSVYYNELDVPEPSTYKTIINDF